MRTISCLDTVMQLDSGGFSGRESACCITLSLSEARQKDVGTRIARGVGITAAASKSQPSRSCSAANLRASPRPLRCSGVSGAIQASDIKSFKGDNCAITRLGDPRPLVEGVNGALQLSSVPGVVTTDDPAVMTKGVLGDS
jgi:hypothetical protein